MGLFTIGYIAYPLLMQIIVSGKRAVKFTLGKREAGFVFHYANGYYSGMVMVSFQFPHVGSGCGLLLIFAACP
jgi:carotenoid cleavage dioxygenase-like enzyme